MIQVRATAPEELRAAARAVSLALLQAPHDDASWEKSEPSWRDCDSLTARDGERCVGHAAGYRVQTLIAYGDAWYPWYMRRLAERPANVAFAIRSLLP